MNQDWEFSAKSVTKYNPVYRDEQGHYEKEEWIGFFQLGRVVSGELLTYDEYVKVENRYVLAAKLFLTFNNCSDIMIVNLEKREIDDFSVYFPNDETGHIKTFTEIKEGAFVSGDDIDNIIRLILREVVWAELVCKTEESVAIRFGYDFYMYFNSPKKWEILIPEIEKIGLFVY
ncbi:MAG: hypothetical protein QM781_13170 [Chitinophagaceae bacterium]